MVIASGGEGTAVLDMELGSPVSGQVVEVVWNGVSIEKIAAGPELGLLCRSMSVPVGAGDNWLVFRYVEWNGRESTFAPGDFRAIAVRFTRLTATTVPRRPE
jgi:hypothetical protein